jgi:hypothetical protein
VSKPDTYKVLQKPRLFSDFLQKHSLKPKDFDSLAKEQYPEYDRFVGYCNNFILSYGMYPVPRSIVKAKTMAQDIGIPMVLMGICSDRVGHARDILEMLGLRYFTVTGCDIERNHFLSLIGLTPRQHSVFTKTLEDNNDNFGKTCKELSKRIPALLDKNIRALFIKTIDLESISSFSNTVEGMTSYD